MFTKWWTESSSSTQAGARAAGRRTPALRRGAVLLLGASVLMAGGCGLLPKEDQEETLPTITPPQISQKPEYEVTTATLERRCRRTES